MKNNLLLRAAHGEKTERTPVWLMRQAGRILPEYRAVRGKLSGFVELVTTPHLAAEVTLQPVDILGVDAAIIFSDILVIPEAMGLPYEMVEKKGPHFPKTVKDERDVKKLRVADAANDLSYVFEAIRLVKKELDGRVPLIGFSGAPFTVFTYMIEGGGSKTFSKARRLLYQNPALAHELLQKITDSTILYLKEQIKAGADLIQVFDSWAGLLNRETYQSFSLPYLSQICNAISEVPVTLFAKGAYFALEDMAKLDCEVLGLDWTMPILESKEKVNGKSVQGNLDPCVLYASEADIQQHTEKMLRLFGNQGYIVNLGHGVYPDTDPAKVKHFIEVVKNFKHEQ